MEQTGTKRTISLDYVPKKGSSRFSSEDLNLSINCSLNIVLLLSVLSVHGITILFGLRDLLGVGSLSHGVELLIRLSFVGHKSSISFLWFVISCPFFFDLLKLVFEIPFGVSGEMDGNFSSHFLSSAEERSGEQC